MYLLFLKSSFFYYPLSPRSSTLVFHVILLGRNTGFELASVGICWEALPCSCSRSRSFTQACKSSALGIWSGYARINWACCFHEVWEQWVTLHRGTYVEKLPARCQKKMCFVTAASAVGQHMLQKCSGCAGNQLELGALTRSQEHRNPTQKSRNFSAGKENTK